MQYSMHTDAVFTVNQHAALNVYLYAVFTVN